MKRILGSCILAAALWAGLGARADYFAAQNGQEPQSPYDTWAKAASNIQDAVNAAAADATVWVGAGRYTLPPNATNYVGSNVVYVNRSLILRSSNGSPYSVVIDGESTNRGIAIVGAARYTLDGLTVSNCYATNYGGGVYVVPAVGTGIVRNCILTDNSVQFGAASKGGGMFAESISAVNYVITNCIIRNNRALGNTNTGQYLSYAGGMYLGSYLGGGAVIADILVESNVSFGAAGGMYLGYEDRKYTFDRCVFRGNRTETNINAIYGGGGIYIGGMCRVVMRNCLMHHNSAYNAAGGAFTSQGQGVHTQEFYNCTIVSNIASSGSGVYIRSWAVEQGYHSVVHMYNSICISNAWNYNFLMTPPPNRTNIIRYSCSFPTNATFQIEEPGNITNTPVFASLAGRNYRLTANSPGLNAGTNLPGQESERDLDGKPRIDRIFRAVDMGCYEWLPTGAMVGIR